MSRTTLTGGVIAAVMLVGVFGVPAPAPAVAAPLPASATAARLRQPAALSTQRSTDDAPNPSSFQIWLKPRLSAAQRFVDAVSSPGNTDYHRYLTPANYTRRFGASRAEVNAVRAWLRAEGATAIRVSAGRDYISADASPSAVRTASVMQTHPHRAAGSDETLGAARISSPRPRALDLLRQYVQGVTGAGSAIASTAPVDGRTSGSRASCSRYWAQHTATIKPAYRGLSHAATAVCGYSAGQLRGAYHLTGGDTGQGQTIALIEIGAPSNVSRDLAAYARANGLPKPAAGQFREQAVHRQTCRGNAIDPVLDSEIAYAMAPKAKQLMVNGDSCNQAMSGEAPYLDAALAPLVADAEHPSASIEVNPWFESPEAGGESAAAPVAEIAHAIDLRAAAEGVGMYYPAGDEPGVAVPADDPDATAVGGTTLGISATGTRLFETGYSDDVLRRSSESWVDDGASLTAGGGGPSPLYPEPAYQRPVVPEWMAQIAGRTGRTGPDISADGDPDSGALITQISPMATGKPGARQSRGRASSKSSGEGGTELAVAIVAGIVADAQQHRSRSFGLINPLLYSLADSTAFNQTLPVSAATPDDDRAVYLPPDSPAGLPITPLSGDESAQVQLLDSQTETETGQVTTVHGFDTMTGLGTPNGNTFIRDLRSGR